MNFKSKYLKKHCITLGILFCIFGTFICYGGARLAEFQIKNLKTAEKAPWYQTVHFDSEDRLHFGLELSNGSFIGMGLYSVSDKSSHLGK